MARRFYHTDKKQSGSMQCNTRNIKRTLLTLFVVFYWSGMGMGKGLVKSGPGPFIGSKAVGSYARYAGGLAATTKSFSSDSVSFVPGFFGIVPHVAYAPRLVDDPTTSFWETVVTVGDVDGDPSHYVIKGFDAANNLVDEVVFDMSGHEVRDWNVNRWFPDLSADQYDSLASITVESDGDFVLSERLKAHGVAAGLELKTVEADDWGVAKSMILSDKEYVPHIAETWNWWTGVANYTDVVGAAGLFTVHDHDGLVTDFPISFLVDDVPVNKVAYVVEDLTGSQSGSWSIFDSDSDSYSYELFGVHENVHLGGSSFGVLSGLNATSSYELGSEFFVPVNAVDWSGVAVLNPNDYVVSGFLEQYVEGDDSPFGVQIVKRSVPFSLEPFEKKTGIVGVSEGYDFDLGGFDQDGVVRVVLDGVYDQWSGAGGLAVELVQGDDSWSHNEGVTGLGRLDVGKRLVASYVSNTTVSHDGIFVDGELVGGTITPHETYLSLTNVDVADENPTIQLYTNGVPNGQAASVHLKPFQTWSGTLTDLFGSGKEGMLVIESGKMVGSYTLMGSDVDSDLVADEHLQSSMLKMVPKNRGDMRLDHFTYPNISFVEPGVNTRFEISYTRTDGPDEAREFVVDWGDGSALESIASSGFSGAEHPYHTYAEMGSYDVVIKGFLDDGNMIPDFVEHKVVDVVPEANMASFTYFDMDHNPTDTLHANEPFYVQYKLENFTGEEIDGLKVTFAPNSTGPTTVTLDDIGVGQSLEGEAYVESGIDGDASDVVDKFYNPAAEFNYVGSDDWHNNVYENGEYTLAGEPIYINEDLNGDYRELSLNNLETLAEIFSRPEVIDTAGVHHTYNELVDYFNFIFNHEAFKGWKLNDSKNIAYLDVEGASNNGYNTTQTVIGEQYFDEVVDILVAPENQ